MLIIYSAMVGAGVTTTLVFLGSFFLGKKRPSEKIGLRKFRLIEQQLPNFLSAVSSSLSSGSSLLQSLETANEKTPSPLKSFVSGILNMVKAGMPLEKALEKTAKGLKKGSLLLALYSMAASYRSGGNMVQSLSQLANLCRERESLREKIQASTAQSRMQGMVLILVPIFFLGILFLTSPGNFKDVLLSPLGRKLLLAAGVFQFLGMLIIKRMLKQEIL